MGIGIAAVILVVLSFFVLLLKAVQVRGGVTYPAAAVRSF